MQIKVKQQNQKTILPKIVWVLLFFTLFTGYLPAQIEIRPDDRADYALRANAEFNNDNWEQGKNIVDEGLKRYPRDSDLRMLLGKYYFHEEQYDKSRYELIKALERNPDNVDARQILVNVETVTKRYSSAICYVNELLEVNPYWKGLWQKKIELYRLQGNIVEANRLLKRINQIYPQDTVLYRDYVYETEMAAIAKQKEGQIDEAIALRSELISAEPQNPQHYIGLANDYIKAGDYHNALASTERGLAYAPDNMELILKKAGLLSDQLRYNELLSFLQQQMQINSSPVLRQHYNYYLLEAARNAKDNEPVTLYGKILEANPGNDEAFNYVFNNLYENHQYEEAMHILNRYRGARGESKNVLLKELSLHKKMENTGRAAMLTKQLFAQYPDDTDLRDEYVKIVSGEAKTNLAEERYVAAIDNLREVMQYGDDDMVKAAQNSIYNAAAALGDYNTALDMLNNIILDEPDNPDLYVKRADIYHKLERYHYAFTAYEQVLSLTLGEEKLRHLGGYADMAAAVIKTLNEQFKYVEAMQYVERWLEQDPANNLALRYAVNLSNQMNKKEDMHAYAMQGNEAYPDDIFFKIKIAEYDGLDTENYADVYEHLRQELRKSPYHETLINTFSQLSENYAGHLIKENRSTQGLEVLDTALLYAPDNRSLKYMKGVAYEKLHRFDSAYYYQSFYEPALLELSEFKQHLNYLHYKRYNNEIGLYHLRSRHGDTYTMSSISTIEYSRFEESVTYIGRINYAGREPGKGFQLQGEWSRIWNEQTHTRIDIAGANRFFPKIVINASLFRELNILNGLEGELGVGYRWLPDKEYFSTRIVGADTLGIYHLMQQPHLSNLVVGVTKELDLWRLNFRFNNYILSSEQIISYEDGSFTQGEKQTQWFFNLSGQVRYHLSSPKSYVMGMAGVGTAPDVDLINNQLYDNFSGLNMMVGAGIGHMITKTVSAGVTGTWYNYPTDLENYDDYRNLYNIYLNINVAF